MAPPDIEPLIVFNKVYANCYTRLKDLIAYVAASTGRDSAVSLLSRSGYKASSGMGSPKLFNYVSLTFL
jgi:hypothetical protein